MVLIEALVGMLILLLVVSASLTAMAHGAKQTFQNNLRGEVIDQLRAKMASEGVALCGTTVALAAAKTTAQAAITCQAYDSVTVSFPGASKAVGVSVPTANAQIMTATVNSPAVGGILTVSASR